jgi:hypothetical protein
MARTLESGRMTTPWTSSLTGATGQVFEFRLWATLVEQSRGLLHVFLPLADRGIDALVHRLPDGAYFRVQAKGPIEPQVWRSVFGSAGGCFAG